VASTRAARRCRLEWDVDALTQFLGPAYGEVSPDGVAHFPVVATKIGEMAAVEPNLEAAELAIVPGTSHFLVQEKPDLVNKIVVDFLTLDPVPTVAAIRRAAPAA
jgi:pimeloyl-ACP methyl ester carboxylesterase